MRNGFTLIELGVILAVLAIGIAYVAPDFVETARGDMATRTAKELGQIADAAKWFYLNEGGEPLDPTLARWPGERLEAVAPPVPPAQCAQLLPPNSPRDQLVASNYLQPTNFVNPWGLPYQLSLVPAGGTAYEGCRLAIATNVPETVAGEIKTYLPLAACESIDGGGACPGNPPSGQDRCCTKVVRPGQEAILQEWIAAGTLCAHMRGGAMDGDECDVRGRWAYSSCYETTGQCADGYVGVGNRMVGCGKFCQETRLRCCRGAP